MIVYCCQKGCGECEVDEKENSSCCNATTFKWDTEKGVVVSD